MTKFTGLMENPVPDVLAMLDAMPTTEVAIFVMFDIYGKSLCVHASDESPFGALDASETEPKDLNDLQAAIDAVPHAVVIAAGEDPFAVAAVVGLVHRHNVGVQTARAAYDQAMRCASANAAAAFIAQAIVDFHFGIDFGREIHAQPSKYANESNLGGG